MQIIRDVLHPHNHIAYDLDGTLFGLYGDALADYIRSTPHKQHSILTSRQSALLNASTQQLMRIFGNLSVFSNIIHSPSPVLEGHQVNINFKGNECKRIGATALVDDYELHRSGCIANGIEFVFIHGLNG